MTPKYKDFYFAAGYPPSRRITERHEESIKAYYVSNGFTIIHATRIKNYAKQIELFILISL